MSRNAHPIPTHDLLAVTGGVSTAAARKFAKHELGATNVFAGVDVTNSTSPAAARACAAKPGVLVSTGDDPGGRGPQFYVGCVVFKHGQPSRLQDM